MSQSTRRVTYLPEPTYFHARDFDRDAAGRITAVAASQWADVYAAWPTGYPAGTRSGRIPRDPSGRERLIAELCDEFSRWMRENHPELPPRVSLLLTRRSAPILSQPEGIPGVLHVQPRQFTYLQDTWQANGFQRDLYFRADAAKRVVRPHTLYGGVVLVQEILSPLQQLQQQDEIGDSSNVPSDDARRMNFVHACDEFTRAVLLRQAEVTEPGKAPDPGIIHMFSGLLRDVDTIKRAT